jgi:hypothetical protein
MLYEKGIKQAPSSYRQRKRILAQNKTPTTTLLASKQATRRVYLFYAGPIMHNRAAARRPKTQGPRQALLALIMPALGRSKAPHHSTKTKTVCGPHSNELRASDFCQAKRRGKRKQKAKEASYVDNPQSLLPHVSHAPAPPPTHTPQDTPSIQDEVPAPLDLRRGLPRYVPVLPFFSLPSVLPSIAPLYS